MTPEQIETIPVVEMTLNERANTIKIQVPPNLMARLRLLQEEQREPVVKTWMVVASDGGERRVWVGEARLDVSSGRLTLSTPD